LDVNPTVIYSTLIHEFNHMINFNVKVIQTKNEANYEAWYTEMLSMLAEDVIGPLVGIPANTDGHVIEERIPYWLYTYMNSGVMQWPYTSQNVLAFYASNYAFGAYLVRNFGGPTLLEDIAKSPSGGKASLDESLRKFNGANIDSQYALARFGEVLVYSGNKKPDGAYSFDKTVTQTVGGKNYTFFGFDVWNTYQTGSATRKGPWIDSRSGVSAQIQPYGVFVTQDSAWKNKSGSLVINLSRADIGAYYFVMKK
jgi:hypothetical protein